ncbi:MAG: TIR domain-containing protein [Acidobacteria bacterium]|nr:TIR domain-containing protein [Acidobacteriota bacterium]
MPAQQVFLSHNSVDKPVVRAIAESLQQRGVRVWLDEWELRPGTPWQVALEEGIEASSATAVFVGPSGLGPWEQTEMRAALDLQVQRKRPVIPIALPGMPRDVPLPLFLRANTWVSFRTADDSDALDRLYWGITGTKPRRLIGPRRRAGATAEELAGDPVDSAVASLVEHLQSGTVTYFVGPATEQSRLDMPPDNDEIARAIFEDLALWQLDSTQITPPVDLISTCYAARSGDRRLEDRVRELVINRSYIIPNTHRLLARLLKSLQRRARSRTRRLDTPLIVTTNFDMLIERALLAEGVPFSRVVQQRSHDEVLVNVYDKFTALPDRKIQISEGGRPRTLNLDDLEEVEVWLAGTGAVRMPARDVSFARLVEPILYKHHGSHDVDQSCVISTDHYLGFIHRAARPGFVPTDVESLVENSPAALFLGYNPLDPDFRLLYHVLLSERLLGSRTFRYAPLSSEWNRDIASYRQVERRLWADFKEATQQQMGITILDATPEHFMSRLVEASENAMEACDEQRA